MLDQRNTAPPAIPLDHAASTSSRDDSTRPDRPVRVEPPLSNLSLTVVAALSLLAAVAGLLLGVPGVTAIFATLTVALVALRFDGGTRR